MGDIARRVPTGLIIALAVVLLGLGGLWWVRAAPPATAAEHAAPVSRSVSVRMDDGRVFTYQIGRSLVPNPVSDTASQRRYCRRSSGHYPTMRIVEQDAPPVFLTRCG